MTIHPACFTPETNGEEIARLMIECDCGEIPVVQDWQSRKLIGVATDRDIVCRLVAAGRNPLESRARDCMSSPVVFATAETDLDECCRLMEQHRIRRLPIVDAEGRCCARAVRGARNRLVDLEEMTDEELEALREQFRRLKRRAATAGHDAERGG